MKLIHYILTGHFKIKLNLIYIEFLQRKRRGNLVRSIDGFGWDARTIYKIVYIILKFEKIIKRIITNQDLFSITRRWRENEEIS